MRSKHADKAIKNTLVSVMKSIDRKVTATMTRKLVTRLVRENMPELASPLTEQLNHSDGRGTLPAKIKPKSPATMVRAISKCISKAAAEEKTHAGQCNNE